MGRRTRAGACSRLPEQTASITRLKTPAMIAKYEIEYTVNPSHNSRVGTHRTDDPVEAEDFLTALLIAGARIHGIKHEGVELSAAQNNRMLHVAAERLVSGLLRTSLKLDAAEVKHRFGFAA
jgi:hypothetical protein